MPETTELPLCSHGIPRVACSMHPMTDPKLSTGTIVAGALMRRSVRNELERLRFLGHQVEWHEAKGFIESTFTVRGSPEVMRKIGAAVREWNKDV